MSFHFRTPTEDDHGAESSGTVRITNGNQEGLSTEYKLVLKTA